MSDNNNLLLKPHTRKWFFASCFITLILLVLIRYFIIPILFSSNVIDYYKITNTIIDNFIVVLVSAISVSFLVLFFNPPVMQKATVEVIGPFEIKNVLRDALIDVKEFWYIGHTAVWTRVVTMKELLKYAKNNNTTIDIYIVILDPSIKSSLLHNAEIQKRVKINNKTIDDIIKDTRLELFATIVSMYSWNQEESLLNIQVALTDKISLFRIDLYSKFAIISQADPRSPFLKYDNGSIFYKSYREEVRIKFKQSRKLSKLVEGVPFDDLSYGRVKELLTELGFDISDLDDNDFGEIIKKIKGQISPY